MNTYVFRSSNYTIMNRYLSVNYGWNVLSESLRDLDWNLSLLSLAQREGYQGDIRPWASLLKLFPIEFCGKQHNVGSCLQVGKLFYMLDKYSLSMFKRDTRFKNSYAYDVTLMVYATKCFKLQPEDIRRKTPECAKKPYVTKGNECFGLQCSDGGILMLVL